MTLGHENECEAPIVHEKDCGRLEYEVKSMVTSVPVAPEPSPLELKVTVPIAWKLAVSVIALFTVIVVDVDDPLYDPVPLPVHETKE
jgi:hypothetical protein